MSSGRPSNCSAGVEVDFYWYDCVVPDGHVDAAVDALWAAVNVTPGRLWNPWTAAMAKKEFRRRLLKAQAGELAPIAEVKVLGTGGEVLFEIAWKGLTVMERTAGGDVPRSLEVRLIHAEPIELSVCAVGLHAHEKRVYPDDPKRTHDDQDAEIDVALVRYNQGIGHLWGVKG